MSSAKLDLLPFPDCRQIEERLWFKIRLDTKMMWQPDLWQPPAFDEQIQTVISDDGLKTFGERVERLATLSGRGESDARAALTEGKWRPSKNTYVYVTKVNFDKQQSEPVPSSSPLFWFYRNRLVKVRGREPVEELILRIKHKVLVHERGLDRVRREVEAFENFEKLDCSRRAPIPQHVQMFVWQRDHGRCVNCGSAERLEYDHVIPLVKGGSNTERNIQLLCEACNRQKGAEI